MMTTTLQKYIQSLDPKTLPRVLQIQSGFYDGGPTCEFSGNECSLSTGDVIKITGIKIQKVLARVYNWNEYDMMPTVELSLDFPGLFTVVVDTNPYYSIEEIVQTQLTGSNQFTHLCFYSQSSIHVGDITIDKGKKIMLNSVEKVNGVVSVKCEVIIEEEHHSFMLPLSYTGEFYECPDKRIYTLQEILDWKMTKNRMRTVLLSEIMVVSDIENVYYSNIVKRMMVLSPVYDVHALMQYGDVLNLLSDLDVEVLDITQHINMNFFSQVLTTQNIFEKTTDEFPFTVEIMEGPLKNCKAYKLLRCGKRIIVHRKYQAERIIASEIRSDTKKRHFLIPSNYKGKFKRRPRFFPTVYDLKIVKREMIELQVVATKSFTSFHKELSSLSVGDQLWVKQFQTCEITYGGEQIVVDTMQCTKTQGEIPVEITLPLYVEGGFIELVHDDKQYYLSELCKHFQLPLNVKVSVRDLFTVGSDILAKTSALKLEEQITDSYLLVSLCDNPEEVWELPVFRLNLTFRLISGFDGKVFSLPTKTNTEEINEQEYYMVRRYESHVHLPPPRPPKTLLYVNESEATITHKECFTEDPPQIQCTQDASTFTQILSESKNTGKRSQLQGSSDGETLQVCNEKDTNRTIRNTKEKETKLSSNSFNRKTISRGNLQSPTSVSISIPKYDKRFKGPSVFSFAMRTPFIEKRV
ncbi:protein THEMIS [Pseudophryne corroboree]|uniref:protein THEMIS n=1 Tax=Pseudophryne corroboree TaxID=495146 RepID=UPI0030816635